MAREIRVASVLNKGKKRDAWFLDDYRLNLYSSCSFNCLYCYIRGSKFGTNLETSLSVKINALEILEKQLALRAKKQEYGFIALSSATDPYLQLEKKYALTREALKIILKYKFPVHIITKSDLITRDFDILHQINKQAVVPRDLSNKLKGVIVSFSFSTLNNGVAGIFEPGATLPSLRIEALRLSVKEKFHSGVSLMPLLPFISDTTEHLQLLFSTFKACKVNYAMPCAITLFGNEKADSKTLVLNAIKKHFPHLENKYIHYFKYSNEMPEFYRIAFSKKMWELSLIYGINNRII